MSNYYYYAASLPRLEFGAAPSLSSQEFLEDCERLLAPGDFETIKQVTCAPIPGNRQGVLPVWQQFVHSLRNEAAWFRANQEGKDPLDHVRGERIPESSITLALTQASKSSDPLTGEKLLDRLLWEKLDELAQGHYFDMDFLVIYAARLNILERHKEIASPKGQEILEEYKSKAFY